MRERTALSMFLLVGALLGGCDSSVPAHSDAPRLCVGTPAPCEACLGSDGCFGQGTCEGEPNPCGSFSQSACDAQSGCDWLPSESRCVGTADACIHRTSQRGCDAQRGCMWTVGCVGTPTPCAAINPALCHLQPGCM